ncbi:hypothetical protein SPRA44_240028 [Serratia proteamaculans]|nr:hypothetical protein SPRA44_240028 [Serratia proteamaculans]
MKFKTNVGIILLDYTKWVSFCPGGRYAPIEHDGRFTVVQRSVARRADGHAITG